MSAFDDFLERSSKEKFEEYRKDLVSTRGNFSSGTLAEYMDVSRRARNASLFDDEEATTTSTLEPRIMVLYLTFTVPKRL